MRARDIFIFLDASEAIFEKCETAASNFEIETSETAWFDFPIAVTVESAVARMRVAVSFTVPLHARRDAPH